MGKYITDIIFDLDGTLIDSAPAILESFKIALEKNNIESICQLNSDIIGPPLIETLTRITGIDDEVILNKLAEDFKGYYDLGGYRATKPFPGIGELLKECNLYGFRLHIATNKRLVPTTLILEHLGWRHYFKSIYALDSKSPSFRDKGAMLLALLDVEKISSNSAFYVGDRVEDYQSAIGNNLNFLGATWGYQDQKLVTNEAINCCPKVEKFSQYINN
ncbi:HAD hydrolase-like protein [Polynucleobacter paneuropaeus]|jgi:phosphoglycolate phosphatase|nr:HAD hydrolase-like protein [Polynucleobacter paneuropaeus]